MPKKKKKEKERLHNAAKDCNKWTNSAGGNLKEKNRSLAMERGSGLPVNWEAFVSKV